VEVAMTILNDAAQLVKERISDDFQGLTIERMVIGLFFTGVKLSNGAGGICFTPVKEIPEAVCCPSSVGSVFDPRKVKKMKAKDLLGDLYSKELMKAAAAIATLNALTSTCLSQGWNAHYNIKMNRDALDRVIIKEGASVAVVGALVPALRVLKERSGTWWVIEQDPQTLKADELPHFVPFHKSEGVINQADVLIITGVTLLNHTLEGILQVARPDAEIAVIGPTASLFPEPLFDRGVRVVGGVWVKRPDELLDVLAAGGSGYHFLDTLADRIVIEKSKTQIVQ